MAGISGFVRRLALVVAVAVTACSGAPGTQETEGVDDRSGAVELEGGGNDFEVKTNNPPACATPPLTGECLYSPVEAFASSVENNSSSYEPSRAIDGSCSTRWSSKFSDPQWLKVDLGSSRPLSRLVIHWENAASSSYEVQVSNDAASWTKVATKANATITGSGSSRVDAIAGLTATARYVRIYSLARTTSYGNSIFELEVFGTGCAVTPGCSQIPVIPLGAVASSVEHAAKGPEKAIDGNSSTRWSSAFSDPQWLRLDLGQTRSVGRVQIDWENSASAKYELQVSDSPTGPWTVIHTHQDSRVGPRKDDISGLVGSGRYLRLNSTKRTTNYGVSLFEIRVFRSSCTGCEQVLVPSATAASSTESNAYPASKAVDGDYSTRWSSQFSDPQWLRLDFGQARNVNQVIIRWENSASKNYRIEGSGSSNGPWQVLAQRSNQPAGPRWDFVTGLDASVRFLRIYSTARTTGYGNSIYEIIVLGRSSTACQGHGQCLEDDPQGQKVCDCDIRHSGVDCGTSNLPNGDGDNEHDLDDDCPNDPSKTEPGICGCNVSEADTDGDQVPDCEDKCPNDSGNQIATPCGCAGQNNFRPSGTACVVEACSGSVQEATCTGQGRCGLPECAPLDQGCKFRIFRDHGYWFCDGDVSWQQAETLCGEEPGRSMVQVNSLIENLWLTSVTGGDTWLGGHDLEQDGEWNWSYNGLRNATPFWVDGLPIPARYNRWQAGAPSSGQCLKLLGTSDWLDAGCSETHGFVCEQPVLNRPVPIDPPRPCDFFPGTSCDTGGANPQPTQPPTGCIEGSTDFLHTPGNPDTEPDNPDYIRVKDATNACKLACADADDDGCMAGCTGFATVPVGNCQEYSPFEKAHCQLDELHPDPNQKCTRENPTTCPSDYVCGTFYECAALNANNEATPCQDVTDCAAGQYCRETKPTVCINPDLKSNCDASTRTVIDGVEHCVGVCFGTVACGKPKPECALYDNNINPCSTTLICPDPGTVNDHTDPTKDRNSNLTLAEFPVEQYFPPVQDSYPQKFQDAKPEGCGGPPPEQPCTMPGSAHPWCLYNVDESQTEKMNNSVSDSDEAFDDKRGTGGSDGPVRFDFDPNLDIGFNVSKPLPLGDALFEAHATASALAAAQFSLFGIDGTVNILDALGELKVDRCGITSDARLKLFGYDFLPIVLGDDVYANLNALDTPQDIRDSCDQTLTQIQTVVERAQKAMRDTQDLIRQQKELVADGKRFSPDLCHQLLEGPGKGLPANFPSAAEPFQGCGDLSPEDTINLFIRYYQEQVIELKDELDTLLEQTETLIPSVTIPFLGHVDEQTQAGQFDEANRETQEIANINFAIGPIPMNLTIEAYAQYGMAGNLTFSLTPSALFDSYGDSDGNAPGDERHDDATARQIAGVDASLTPYAGAGVSMFVGVGFSFSGFSAKAGISGTVSLGTVTLPIYAGAGIGVAPELDDRQLPDDVAGMVASKNMLFPPGPPKKYRFEASYKFGVEATIAEVLQGTISAKLRIEFLWFSKSWQKQVASFGPAIDPIHLTLIHGQGSAGFADASGVLGYIHMPLAFVDFAPLEEPPPLPPLPDPNTGGTGGTSSSGGASGSSGAGTGTGGSNRPPVSLLVQGDPRYADFSDDRAVSLFYDGYCDCNDGTEGPCTSNLSCCGDMFCAANDFGPNKFCLACVPLADPLGRGSVCETTDQCCDKATGATCQVNPSNGSKYCQRSCTPGGQPLPAGGTCCEPYRPFTPEHNGGGPTMCIFCQGLGQSCNVSDDCCDLVGGEQICKTDFTCDFPPIVVPE